MERQNIRVILASEYPEVQCFLREFVEQQDGAVIVGQADNAAKALTLTRTLRPDVALIDCYLPHTVGSDNVALSRIGGLDTAQIISQEIPKARVVLIPNLDKDVLPQYVMGPDNVAFLARKTGGASTPFALQALYQEALAGSVTFADVEVKPRAALRQKSTLTEKAMFFGGLGIAGGWLLILTMFLAPVGIGLAALGAATMLFGLARKLTASRRAKGTPDKKAGGISS